jgi:hypothetical protein
VGSRHYGIGGHQAPLLRTTLAKENAPDTSARSLLQHLADRHRLKSLLEGWRAAAAQVKQAHSASLRSERCSRAAMLHRGWHAWRQGVQEQHHRSAQRALAQQHRRQKLLVGCWQGWQEWTVRCRDLKQRVGTRRLAAAVQGWRWVAQAAEKR